MQRLSARDYEAMLVYEGMDEAGRYLVALYIPSCMGMAFGMGLLGTGRICRS